MMLKHYNKVEIKTMAKSPEKAKKSQIITKIQTQKNSGQ
jgi:hypothetical protein